MKALNTTTSNPFLCFSYQDRNNKALLSYSASLKWVGVRLDILSSALVTIVTVVAIFLSSDAGLYGFFVDRN